MSLVTSPIGAEALDTPTCPPAVARTMLGDIARANTLFGGRAAVWFGIHHLLTSPLPPLPPGGGKSGDAHPLTVLDLGAGAGDIATFVARRARELGVTLVPVTLDRHRAAAILCREGGLSTLVADALALPLGARSVDIVIASQLLHHFHRDAAIRLLRGLEPLVRRGIVIADLRRSPAAAAGIWLGGLLLRFHPVTRRDGVTSVRRGFSARGLSELLLAAGLGAPVFRRPGYRLVAVWRAPPFAAAQGGAPGKGNEDLKRAIRSGQ
jgi:SAM-dependent methyltransferase